MKNLRSTLTYANVIATIALFLALGGGAVWAAENLGKNAVKSKNIATKAVKSRNLAPKAVKNKHLSRNSVSGGKVRKGTLTRSKLKAGTLPGLQIAVATATGIPGFTTDSTTPDGTAVPLAGVTAFTPRAGKSYLMLGELRGNPTDADGVNPNTYGGPSCYASLRVSVNGEPTMWLDISANANSSPPYDVNPVSTGSTAIGLIPSGQAQTITANSFGSAGCGAGTTGDLRLIIAELG